MAYFLAALFGGFFLFNALATPKKAARAIESSLRQMFPGAQVRAEVQGKRGRDVVKGQFRSARIEMSGFTLGAASTPAPSPDSSPPPTGSAPSGGGLSVQVVPSAKSVGRVGQLDVVLRDFRWQEFRVAQADFSVANVRVDWKALRKSSQLKLVSLNDAASPRTQGRARLVLSQDALLSWVKERYPDIQNATVSLSSDRRVRVRGQKPILGASLPLELAGVFNLRGGRVLEVSAPTVSAGSANLPSFLVGQLTKGLSSIYELDPKGEWPLEVSGAQVKVEDVAGAPALVLEGQVALKAAQVLAPTNSQNPQTTP